MAEATIEELASKAWWEYCRDKGLGDPLAVGLQSQQRAFKEAYKLVNVQREYWHTMFTKLQKEFENRPKQTVVSENPVVHVPINQHVAMTNNLATLQKSNTNLRSGLVACNEVLLLLSEENRELTQELVAQFGVEDRGAFESSLVGILRTAIIAHGPITEDNAHSAAKRLVGQMKAWRKDEVAKLQDAVKTLRELRDYDAKEIATLQKERDDWKYAHDRVVKQLANI